MVKGLYTGYTGMVNSQKRLDVISNNLANATTTGFKAEGCTTQAFDSMYAIKIKDATVGHLNQNIGSVSLGAKIGETYRNWEQGSLQATNNTYDFALAGQGFFSVEFTNKNGVTSTMYSRDGAFQMNSEGYLVTKDGDYILGEGGRIQLPTDLNELSVDFEDYNYLEEYGENLYRAVDGATEQDCTATVQQGYLEASNINVVSEMVDMIAVAREYESGQKVIQAIDEMLGKMVTMSEL